MSFWNLSDDTSATDTKEDFALSGGNLAPIPGDSTVLASIDEAKWKNDTNGNEYIAVQWSVVKPEAYENRKIFQKLWVTDDDPNAKDKASAEKKRDNAKRMLSRIDAESGGKLARTARKPTDDDLALALVGKAMTIKVMVWSMTTREGATMDGNWVAAVMSKSKPVSIGKEAPRPASRQATSERRSEPTGSFDDLDDDVPF